MWLEDYWGAGLKTSDRLESALGREEVVATIESADVRAFVDAGVTRGQAVCILRRVDGQVGISASATCDARSVYGDLLSPASDHGLTERAVDRIRVLAPLSTVEARRDRLDHTLMTREVWVDLDDDARDAVEVTFREYGVAGEAECAAVRVTLELREAGLRSEPFDAPMEADSDALCDALGALGYVDNDGSVAAGVDGHLNSLRSRLDTTKEFQSGSFGVPEAVQPQGIRSLDDFRAVFVQHVAQETGLSRGGIETVAAEGARDAADFVSVSLRTLIEGLGTDVAACEEIVAKELRDRIRTVRDDVGLAVEAVNEAALLLSLVWFVDGYDLTPPDIAETGLAACSARNLFIGDPQPVSYVVGDCELACASGPTLPAGDHVSVLMEANSGGKMTLSETFSQVTILTSMGLPVPAESVVVGRFDSVVFHRRHVSFNAGAPEPAIKSITLPLSGDSRTLMLVSEFEAITELGHATDLLNDLMNLAVEHDAFGVHATHLADELGPLPSETRIDSTLIEGLTDKSELHVGYQPRFGTIDRSMPEFIVSRLVASTRDRAERAGFGALAAAVSKEAVQKTLSDAEFAD